jgi:3-oxoacyl-[acyl-carrier-protein] synthase-3
VVNAVADTGNTSAGSIPLAMTEALDTERIHPGDHVLVSGFGAGMSWATTVLQWT